LFTPFQHVRAAPRRCRLARALEASRPDLAEHHFMAFRLKGTFIDRGIEKEQSTVGAKAASACHCAGRKGVAEGGGAMKKIVCLLKRRDGLSFEAFKDYYENNHTKIFAEFLQTPGVRRYVRRYLTPLSNPVSGATRSSGFDLLMEVWFDNEQVYQGFVGGTMDPKFRDLVIADEEKLFDRSQMFFHVVDEHDSRLPNGVETYGSLIS
jgi:hypothetical protein